MTTHATVERVLPGRPSDILARLRDPEVTRLRAESDPVLQGQVVEFSPGEDADAPLTVTIAAELPTSWIPQVGRGLAGRPRIVRREVWRPVAGDAVDIEVEVVPESVPATTMTVVGRLVPAAGDADSAGTSSLLTYDLGLTVALPIAGRGIERTVLDLVRRAYERECDVIATACG